MDSSELDVGDVQKIIFGDNIPGFEVEKSSSAGLIFVQEWWGVTEIVKQQALLFSREGFRVLVPDLYKGIVGVDMEEASHLLTSLDYHLAVEEIGQAVQYLKSKGCSKIGISGGCMGGALAFAAAQYVDGLTCAAPLYGTPAREMPWIDVTKIRIPISYHTGQLDRIRGFSDPSTAVRISELMKSSGCDIELFIYENTPHSFLNALTPEGIVFLDKWNYGVPPPEQVILCFERLVTFFKRHLL
jgi:carboxymethylenebutenolidase